MQNEGLTEVSQTPALRTLEGKIQRMLKKTFVRWQLTHRQKE